MESYQLKDLSITLEKHGSREFSKVSYPIRYGCFSEIKTADDVFEFNLNGEIKHLQGLGHHWPHPTEWLKRTAGNDWIYYSAGDYKGVFELFGEYYFPCLPYPSNSIMGENPFDDAPIQSGFRSWKSLQKRIKGLLSQGLPPRLKRFLASVAQNDEHVLIARARALHQIIGGQVTVLPPDSRQVDYELVPVMVADGCLYNGGFCEVKSGRRFAPRSKQNITEQIKDLKKFFGRDLRNYNNSVFLGEHDALRVGRELLEFTTERVYETFEFERSYMKGASLFLFGSAHSLLHSEDALFDFLNHLPYTTYINVGLESADPATLAILKKPVPAEMVREAFAKMVDINRRHEKIEITANFVLSDDLPPNHFASLSELVSNRSDFIPIKGGIYLSPIMRSGNQTAANRRQLLKKFHQVKAQNPLPTFLYLIQRL